MGHPIINNPMKLSQRFADFNTEVTEASPLIHSKGVSNFGLSAPQVAEEDAFFTDWQVKWTAYSTAATHTPGAVSDIQSLYNTYHAKHQNLKLLIKSNKSLTLTGAWINTLHLHQDADPRVHVPRPEIVPKNQVQKQTELMTRIFSNNPNPPHETETSLPKDVTKIGRKLAILAAGSSGVPAPEQYHNLEHIGSTIYDIVFSGDQKGARAFLITWYENNRGEHGQDSEPLSFIII